jgi:hypothetical protein
MLGYTTELYVVARFNLYKRLKPSQKTALKDIGGALKFLATKIWTSKTHIRLNSEALATFQKLPFPFIFFRLYVSVIRPSDTLVRYISSLILPRAVLALC